MGKTSLLARGLQLARDEGLKVILTDFQKLNAASFESLEKFFVTLEGLELPQFRQEIVQWLVFFYA